MIPTKMIVMTEMLTAKTKFLYVTMGIPLPLQYRRSRLIFYMATRLVFVVHSSDDDDNISTTTPDTVAPVISGIMATSTTAKTTSIIWNTNEDASGAVVYSTTTPVSSALTAYMLSNATLVSIHGLTLDSLIASTTYYSRSLQLMLWGIRRHQVNRCSRHTQTQSKKEALFNLTE